MSCALQFDKETVTKGPRYDGTGHRYLQDGATGSVDQYDENGTGTERDGTGRERDRNGTGTGKNGSEKWRERDGNGTDGRGRERDGRTGTGETEGNGRNDVACVTRHHLGNAHHVSGKRSSIQVWFKI